MKRLPGKTGFGVAALLTTPQFWGPIGALLGPYRDLIGGCWGLVGGYLGVVGGLLMFLLLIVGWWMLT